MSDRRSPATPDPALAAVHAALDADSSAAAGTAFAALVADYLAATAARAEPVFTAHTPAELAARFDEPLPEDGRPLADVLARVARDILPDCNRLMDPRYMGHQVSAPLPAAIWAEALTGALNQSGAVWEMSPVGTVIETQVIRWMSDLAGLGPDAGGTFTSGGTEATFAGLLAARHAVCPDAWRRGVGDEPPVVVCGEHAHYGVARAVGELGIGTDNIVSIPSGPLAMNVDALERELVALGSAGRRVMAVVATAGSTATGTFDDLVAIGRLCDQRGLWLHIDGAHGASALLSARHRHRLDGIQRARSVAWDPHKMMLMPLSASVVLVRHEQDLESAFSQRAPYLFHAGNGSRNWDQGLRTFQCSRRIDAFKVWIALQRYGAEAIGALYDQLCDTAAALHEMLSARPDFETFHEPESNILCFRYVGTGSWPAAELDARNLDLRAAYNQSGQGWITTTVLNGRRVLRVTLMNPRTTTADLQALIDGLAGFGRR
ncbi:MAG: pyridoxal-dependent decarboxylase [Vicinamibacterales bacterium]|nr:pyridoxal-dependent decarboxylase [Vicinamibacterales bacterium]